MQRLLYCMIAALLTGSLPVSALTPVLPTDGSNATPAFSAAIQQLCASSDDRILSLPTGVFSFHTQTVAIPCAVTIVGQGKGATRLIRRYSGSFFLGWTRGTDQSGGGLRDLQIEAGIGTNGGIAVYVQALADPDANTNSLNRHSFLIDNVQVGREGPGTTTSWSEGIYLDGALNPDNSIGLAPGLRFPVITRTSVSGTTNVSIYLNKVRGAWMEVACFIPLNGSTHYVYMSNGTYGVRLDTNSCAYYIADTSKLLMLNGVPTGPQ